MEKKTQDKARPSRIRNRDPRAQRLHYESIEFIIKRFIKNTVKSDEDKQSLKSKDISYHEQLLQPVYSELWTGSNRLDAEMARSRCDMVLCASQYLLIILFLLRIVHFSPFPRLYHLSLKSGEILPSK